MGAFSDNSPQRVQKKAITIYFFWDKNQLVYGEYVTNYKEEQSVLEVYIAALIESEATVLYNASIS